MVYEWDPARAKRTRNIKLAVSAGIAVSGILVPVAVMAALSSAI